MQWLTQVGLGAVVLLVVGGLARALWRRLAPRRAAVLRAWRAWRAAPPLTDLRFRFSGEEVRAMLALQVDRTRHEIQARLGHLQTAAAADRDAAERIGPMAPQTLTREAVDAAVREISTLAADARRLEELLERVPADARFDLPLATAASLLGARESAAVAS